MLLEMTIFKKTFYNCIKRFALNKNPYLLTITVCLSSDLKISKSEDKTLLAKKIRAINSTMRLKFFMISSLNRFEIANFMNKF